jgi:predicted Rossmann fold nucleotide-binding protein DprA/Smf involved in DNA uptake
MASSQLTSAAVHPDTQVVLLLCGVFGRGGPSVKPLTLSEYNALASWLGRQGRRPASLLQDGGEALAGAEPGLPAADRLRVLLGRGFQMAASLEGWQRLGLWVISRGEACYPERLRRHLRSAAPPLLYGAGDLGRLNLGGLAVVGSRNVDEEGLSFSRRVGGRCAEQGVQIVSGGARGVDRAAVSAALAAGGGAVSVLAERLDRAATAREAREPLRDGQLTLVTPYEPESGFSIGKAIARNKHIYALADCALVVRFKAREGGTWAGAIEQLDRNKSSPPGCPVFVRVAHNPEAGCEELRNMGALLFPEEDFWTNKISDALRQLDAPQSSPSPAASEPDTCYHRCLPLLLDSFREDVHANQLSEIAEKLQLLPKQLAEWLRRAIEEGKLTKTKKKGRIVYTAAKIEQTLFDRETMMVV